MKSCAMVVVGSVIVVVHRAEAPSDAEWDEFLVALTRTTRGGEVRVLVITDGGAPNALQRAKLGKATERLVMWTSVLSDSRVVRAAGTALRWFMPKLRMFAPTETEAALDHLGVPADQRANVRAAAGDLAEKLSLKWRASGSGGRAEA